MTIQLIRRLRLLAIFGVAAVLPAQAQNAADDSLSAEQQQQLAELRAMLDSLEPQSGDIQLADGLATLHVPDNFYFYDADDAEKVLVDLWGNPPGQKVLGMLFPTAYSPVDRDSWAVTVEYVADGYVSDEDAADIDYDDLLKQMKKDIHTGNKDREAAGYGSIELVGWAEPPHYDATAKKLYWAKELRFGASDDTTLNYEIRALGRRGILSMTFVAATSQLDEVNQNRDTVLAMADFNEGHRYFDFDPDIDTVAAYGIGALVAGKLAAKAGLLAGALLLVKKFGIFLVLGLGAFGRRLKKMFSATDTLSP
jgi:uncharacterized membrane-anchored protein